MTNQGASLRLKTAKILMGAIGTMATAMMSMAAYYLKIEQNMPYMTGTFQMPGATLGWAIIMSGSLLLIPVPAKWPTGRNALIIMAILATISLGQASTGIAAITQAGTAQDKISPLMTSWMRNYEPGTGWAREIDAIQEAYKCCGAVDYKVYKEATKFLHGGVPISCCNQQAWEPNADIIGEECGNPPLRLDYLHGRGCLTPYASDIGQALKVMGTFLLIASAMMAVASLANIFMWLSTE